MISCSFCSSCFCLCTTDSMISRSSGVRCDRSGISAAILSTQHQHTALRSATTRHNDGAMCVVPCAGKAVMVSPWTRRARPYRGHRAGDDCVAPATTPTWRPPRRCCGWRRGRLQVNGTRTSRCEIIRSSCRCTAAAPDRRADGREIALRWRKFSLGKEVRTNTSSSGVAITTAVAVTVVGKLFSQSPQLFYSDDDNDGGSGSDGAYYGARLFYHSDTRRRRQSFPCHSHTTVLLTYVIGPPGVSIAVVGGGGIGAVLSLWMGHAETSAVRKRTISYYYNAPVWWRARLSAADATARSRRRRYIYIIEFCVWAFGRACACECECVRLCSSFCVCVVCVSVYVCVNMCVFVCVPSTTTTTTITAATAATITARRACWPIDRHRRTDAPKAPSVRVYRYTLTVCTYTAAAMRT